MTEKKEKDQNAIISNIVKDLMLQGFKVEVSEKDGVCTVGLAVEEETTSETMTRRIKEAHAKDDEAVIKADFTAPTNKKKEEKEPNLDDYLSVKEVTQEKSGIVRVTNEDLEAMQEMSKEKGYKVLNVSCFLEKFDTEEMSFHRSVWLERLKQETNYPLTIDYFKNYITHRRPASWKDLGEILSVGLKARELTMIEGVRSRRITWQDMQNHARTRPNVDPTITIDTREYYSTKKTHFAPFEIGMKLKGETLRDMCSISKELSLEVLKITDTSPEDQTSSLSFHKDVWKKWMSNKVDI